MSKEINLTNQSFTIVTLKLAQKDLQILDEIIINPKQLDFMGHYQSKLLKKKVVKFFVSVGNRKNISVKLWKLIKRNIVNSFLKAMSKNYMWLKIQLSIPNDNYKIPRWHTDGKFYNISNKNNSIQVKLVCTLIGPSTLFKCIDNQTRKNFESSKKNLSEKSDMDLERRSLLDKILFNSKTVQPSNQSIVIFIVGSDNAAIHSEPYMNSPRLFISVLSGSHSEISELATNWKMEFTD